MKKYEFWIDKVAREVVERERKLDRGIKVIRTECGIGASGIPHIGSCGDAIRAYGVSLALKELGIKSEFIAFSDSRDGLRKVPSGLPNWLENYIGQPVTDIPDPFNCCRSYGDHMSLLLVDALRKVGLKFKFFSGADVYKKGLLNEQIHQILLNAERVGQIVKEITGQEKYVDMLPYFPTCENCGKIYTTRVVQLLPNEHKVRYVCDQEFTGTNKNTGKEIVVKGCGFQGEASYFNGNGKLSWKAEFAARWHALKICFEAYGKDIADSVKVNDRVCREVLGFEPPLHIMYEMFLDKSGKKISKSVGNVFTPQVWLEYGSPQSLLLLMYKRFEGTRELDVTDIPRYMDEVDRLDKIYFGLEKVESKRDLVNLTRLFEFINLLKVPKKAGVHIPYSTMVEIAKVLPNKNQLDFALEKLKGFGHVKRASASVRREVAKRLEFAKKWMGDFEKIEEVELKIYEKEKSALRELIEAVKKVEDGEELQAKIFEIANSNEIQPPKFFRLIYRILLKSDKGPRLGPYMLTLGKKEVIEKLKEVI
jgi:lysyl-tRNA synthetase class 1